MESQKKREARGDKVAVDVEVALGPHAQLGTRASCPTFSQGDKARLLRKKEALFFLFIHQLKLQDVMRRYL